MHAHIDTLSITGSLSADQSLRLSLDPCEVARQILLLFFAGMAPEYDISPGVSTGGRNGYTASYSIKCEADVIGFVAVGGNCRSDGLESWQVYLDSRGSHLLMASDRRVLRDRVLLEGWRITRCDVAVDCMRGEYDLETAVRWLEAGEFDPHVGRKPIVSQAGDWLTARGRELGRTLYIGSRKGAKMLRCYEKGKQLGDPASPWVRWEVEFKRDKVDLDPYVLTDPAAFFSGAYPALARVLRVGVERMRTVKESARITLDSLVTYARRSYGRLVHVMEALGLDVVQELTRGVPVEPPRRLVRHLPPVSNTGGNSLCMVV